MTATLELATGITGLTSVTVDIFPDGSDTVDVSAGACTEATNRKGIYTYSATGLSGLKYVAIKTGGSLFSFGWAYLATAGVVSVEESRAAALMQGAGAPIKSTVKRNQVFNSFQFLMTDSSLHAPVTGKSVSVTRSLDGGVFGAGGLSVVTEVGNGIYAVNFSAADMNAGCVLLHATAAGCDDTFERIITEP